MRTSFLPVTTFDRFRLTIYATIPRPKPFTILSDKKKASEQTGIVSFRIDILLHGTPQFFIKRYQTLLIPFSGHFNKRSREINILIIQPYQFRKPHTCRIKHFDNQTVAIPFKPFSKVDIIQQPIHFTFSQKDRKRFLFFRPCYSP